MKLKALFFRALIRGWRKKCPLCGKRFIFIKWIERFDYCVACHYQFEENEGDLWAFGVFGNRIFVFAALIASLLIASNLSSTPLIAWSVRGIVFVSIAFFLVVIMPQPMGVCIAIEYLLRLINNAKNIKDS